MLNELQMLKKYCKETYVKTYRIYSGSDYALGYRDALMDLLEEIKNIEARSTTESI